MKYAVLLQMPVACSDSSIWSYEKQVELPMAPYTGMLLKGFSPNHLGKTHPKADNVIRAVVVSDDGTIAVGLHGASDASRNAEEWDVILEAQGWQRDKSGPLRASPLAKAQGEDDLNDLFRAG